MPLVLWGKPICSSERIHWAYFKLLRINENKTHYVEKKIETETDWSYCQQSFYVMRKKQALQTSCVEQLHTGWLMCCMETAVCAAGSHLHNTHKTFLCWLAQQADQSFNLPLWQLQSLFCPNLVFLIRDEAAFSALHILHIKFNHKTVKLLA